MNRNYFTLNVRKWGIIVYVCQLSEELQLSIRQQLQDMGIEGEDLQNAMDSRLSDLEDCGLQLV
jgi:hypothetical protein